MIFSPGEETYLTYRVGPDAGALDRLIADTARAFIRDAIRALGQRCTIGRLSDAIGVNRNRTAKLLRELGLYEQARGWRRPSLGEEVEP